jgi:dolichyl-phosphate beta-glucosyltransferase
VVGMAATIRLPTRSADCFPVGPIRTRAELELVVPAFNEELRIEHTVRELASYLADSGIDAAIVVVDNGSTDQTAEVVDGLGVLGVDISVIGCARQGKGAAVRRAMLTTRSKFVGFCDADAATPPSTIEAVLPLLRSGSSVVIGSRRCPGARFLAEPTAVRRVGGWVFRQAAGMHVKDVADTQCGYKFFEASVAKQLFGHTTLDGFAFDVELLALAQAWGIEVVEVPVRWSAEEGSTMRIPAGLRALRDVYRPWGFATGGWSI